MQRTKKQNFFIILILGALQTVSPFSIDMYLPAFPQVAADFHTTVAKIALSLSSYFIGLSLGQIFYGPVLDRYGRKKPLYFGLLLYILASIGCVRTSSVETLIALRFLQALGGCGASVACMAMVRDFFPVKESAKVFSLMILILSVSPLLAPTVGTFVTAAWGWKWVFLILAGIALAILLVCYFFLPEGHAPDTSVSLKLKPVYLGFKKIIKNPQFYTYAFSGAFQFCGLLVYVTGSPIIFLNVFHVSTRVYGAIFAMLSVGFIGASQLNIFLSRRFSVDQIFRAALICQVVVSFVFFILTYLNLCNLPMAIIFIFFCLVSLGFGSPNGSALSLAPFSKNAGSAAALLGFLQIGLGAVASAGIGMFGSDTMVPTIAILSGTSFIAFLILSWGRKNIVNEIDVAVEDIPVGAH